MLARWKVVFTLIATFAAGLGDPFLALLKSQASAEAPQHQLFNRAA
jgi:hypothetical protein